MNNNTDLITLGIGIIAIIALIIAAPYFSIWAINTLFSTTIPLNFWTWLATCWLHIVLSPNVKQHINNNQ